MYQSPEKITTNNYFTREKLNLVLNLFDRIVQGPYLGGPPYTINKRKERKLMAAKM
jgi:hypothetical protein